jgi:hypothetical protein
MTTKLKCIELWQDWISIEPECREVLETKDKIKQYNRSDWEVMSKEAEFIMFALKELSDKKIDLNSEEAKKVFYEFSNHLEKWFFKPDNISFDRTISSLNNNSKYKLFYNQYGKGIAEYLKKLVLLYKKEYISSNV